MRTSRLLRALVPLGFALVVGCAADDSPPSSPADVLAPDVVGTWTWDDTASRTTPSVTLRVDGTVEGHDGCNPMAGRWRLDVPDGVVRIDDLAATSYASCTDDGEQTAVQRLHDTTSLVLAGDRLEARDARGRTIATLTRVGG